jgi:cytochrome c biogenesis protein ResB
MMKILKLFLSLKTTLWLLLLLLCLLFYGAIIMPVREEFSTINSIALLSWLSENPSGVTWWLYAIIGLLSILTANTIFCSIESLIKKWEARRWLLIISPQVIHIGFLFILLAHLLSSWGSFRDTAVVYKGYFIQLPNGFDLKLEDMHVDIDQSGYLRDWSADIKYFREGQHVQDDVIYPNHPSFYRGLGIYLKDLTMSPYPAVLIEISKEPGAIWALIGGILFILGMVTLLILKIKREETKG